MLDQGILHGFGSIVHQVYDDSLHLLGVDVNQRQRGGQIELDVDVVEPSLKHGQTIAHRKIEIVGGRLRRWKTREFAEFIDQILDRLDLSGNGDGAFAQNASGLRRHGSAIQLARDALGTQGNRGQRILELMRDAPRDLVPGGGLLGAQQVRGILENDHEAGSQALFECGYGDGQVKGRAAHLAHFHLIGGDASATRALHQVLDFGRVVAGKEVLQPAGGGDAILREQATSGAISALYGSVRSHRQDPRGNSFENRFSKLAAALELAAVGFQFLHHLVEPTHERAEFIHGRRGDAMGEVALADLLGGVQ